MRTPRPAPPADVARLRAAFRPHGIHRGPPATHRPAGGGWESLTPAEVTVAMLVAEGLSNRGIAARFALSPRTVATHVSHILRKLDVASRADIAREAALRKVPAPPRQASRQSVVLPPGGERK